MIKQSAAASVRHRARAADGTRWSRVRDPADRRGDGIAAAHAPTGLAAVVGRRSAVIAEVEAEWRAAGCGAGPRRGAQLRDILARRRPPAPFLGRTPHPDGPPRHRADLRRHLPRRAARQDLHRHPRAEHEVPPAPGLDRRRARVRRADPDRGRARQGGGAAARSNGYASVPPRCSWSARCCCSARPAAPTRPRPTPRRSTPPGPAPRSPASAAVGASFLVLFAAEWGDLSQLLTLSLVAKYDDPVSVFIGAWSALLAVSGLAVLVGRVLLSRMRLLHAALRRRGRLPASCSAITVWELVG